MHTCGHEGCRSLVHESSLIIYVLMFLLPAVLTTGVLIADWEHKVTQMLLLVCGKAALICIRKWRLHWAASPSASSYLHF